MATPAQALLGMLLLAAVTTATATPAVRVAGPDPVAARFAALLAQRAPGIEIAARDGPADLLVTVGARAFEEALAADGPPVVGVALTRHAYGALAGPGARRRHTALFWDPDPVLHLRLAHAIMPGARRAGLLLSAPDPALEAALGREAARLGLDLVVARVDAAAGVPGALTGLLRRSDFLLGIDDPGLFSPESVKSLLLTSYRLGRPVFGPGGAYVEAGSVAAVAIDLEDVVAALAGWLPALQADALPPPRHTPGRTVRTNPRVARSLGIVLPPAPRLQQSLQEATP